MKNYLSSNISLKGCIIPMIFMIITYATLIFTMNPQSSYVAYGFLSFIAFFASAISLSFCMRKGIINGLFIEEEPLKFDGSLGRYFLILIGYTLLSMITVGITIPLLIKKSQCFFIDNTTYKKEAFKFKGKIQAMVIFMIIYLAAFITISIIAGTQLKNGNIPSGSNFLPLVIVYPLILVLISFISAYLYNWYANIDYKNYNFHFRSSFSAYITPWLLTILGTVFSLGLVTPFLNIWIAKKYINDLEATNEESTVTFSEELDIKEDGIYLLGQTILTIFTIGIYLPIAQQKILNRIIPKIAYTKES
ncbi:DUF898 domain-containing protein [Halosquirtibacter xylanolyticus]|uniref:DUF898 family protein n=1 Tax=Halosquirtibacter xylanolyticus TaxID=3374599 RepID=UPI003748A766|nr:DUF898 domain-containing protein [Prolixibacteraceae bacterium]